MSCYYRVTMGLARAITVLLLAAFSTLQAKELSVCLENDRGLAPGTLGVMKPALQRQAGTLGLRVRYVECGEAVVRIRMERGPGEGHPADALGATVVRGGVVRPEILIFTDNVRRMLPTRLAAVEGAALARVAAHELEHWVTGRQGHDGEGRFAPVWTVAHLMAGDR